MSEFTRFSPFEKEIQESFIIPDIRPEFFVQLQGDLVRLAKQKEDRAIRPFYRRPVWVIAAVLLCAAIIGFLIVGPERVYAAARQLFGYIPGVGIVDTSAPFRVLEKPVSLTHGGITVSVNQGFLTADKTHLESGVSGVPLSAYPKSEIVSGCTEPEYIRLPDGTHQKAIAPIPASVNDVIFVMPCIQNTLPGAAPQDWELALHFIPAPAGLTVVPITETAPTLPVSSTPTPVPTGFTAVPAAPTTDPTPAFSFDKVITTQDGYILVGWFRPHLPPGERLTLTSGLITDANGQKVETENAQDIDLSYSGPPLGEGDFQFAFHFKAAGLAFPLNFKFSGPVFTPAGKDVTGEFEFDAGNNPLPGQEWMIDRDIQMGSQTIHVVSVRAVENGYGFQFQGGQDRQGPQVQIAGHKAAGAGGGPAGMSLIFNQMPKGKLRVILSDLFVKSRQGEWRGLWQPETQRNDWPTATSSPSPVCLNSETIKKLKPLPDGLDGWALASQLNPEKRLVMVQFHGGQTRLAIPDATRGALTEDGAYLAYPSDEGIIIVETASGQKQVIKGSAGYDLHWSPDGQQIAFINPVEPFGLAISNRDGSGLKYLSRLGYESIGGWSPDGKRVYFSIPDSGGKGFMLRSADVQSGITRDLFVLENSSRKAPMPAVSPDGKWIAYRASDNNSLYLKAMDGSPATLLMDKPAIAINGLEWEKGGHLLGVSLITEEDREGEIILMQFENCETYRLPDLHGVLNAIFIP